MDIENLVGKIENLSGLCKQLQRALVGFECVLSRENDAIRRSDINELESITDEKITFGGVVEAKSSKIKSEIDGLVEKLELDPNPEKSYQLDDIIVVFLAKLGDTTLSPKLINSIEILRVAVSDLSQVRFKIFPKIEANTYLVKKLLQYHRETYIFWQAVASDSEAVYGKTGRALTPAKKSILTVRT